MKSIFTLKAKQKIIRKVYLLILRMSNDIIYLLCVYLAVGNVNHTTITESYVTLNVLRLHTFVSD
jgi:hypothetical protein